MRENFGTISCMARGSKDIRMGMFMRAISSTINSREWELFSGLMEANMRGNFLTALDMGKGFKSLMKGIDMLASIKEIRRMGRGSMFGKMGINLLVVLKMIYFMDMECL